MYYNFALFSVFRIVFIWYGSGSSFLGWIPIRSGSNPDPDPGFWWPNIEKSIQLKKITFFKIENYNIPTVFLGLHKGRPSYRRSLQPIKENILHLKTWKFLIFLYFCVICALLDPDPLTSLNPDPIRIRIRTLFLKINAGCTSKRLETGQDSQKVSGIWLKE